MTGAEALVRWMHPQKGLIPPNTFISVFERNGFIRRMDEYIWEQVCILIRAWRDKGLPTVPVSINISRHDIYGQHPGDIIMRLLNKYKLDASMLHLEVTETAFMHDPQKLVATIDDLKNRGFRVEMDDFGSGYSSLNTLKEVNVDTLKMDMRFLESGKDDSKAGRILSSVIRMASWLDLPVIAEGVETKVQADYLKSLGCTHMQGYYFARPMPADKFEQLLSDFETNTKPAAHNETVVEGALDFLNASTQATLMFNSFVGGAQILELHGDRLETLRVNDRFYEMLGMTRDEYEAYKFHIHDRFYPESKADFIATLRRAAATGKELQCELHSLPIREGGSDFWTQDRVRHLARNGERDIFYIAVDNITERRALDETRKRLDAIVKNVPAGIAIYEWGDVTYLRFVSDKICELYGYTRDEYDAFIKQGIPVGKLPGFSLSEMKAENTPNGYSSEDIVLAKKRDGSRFWLRIVYTVVKSEGQPTLVYTTQFDITQRHLAELDAQTRKRELEMALNASALYFWTFDLTRDLYCDANKNAAELGFGTTVDGKNNSIFSTGCFAPDGEKIVKEHIENFYRSHDAVKDDSIVVHMDKQNSGMEWMRILYAVVRDDTGAAHFVSFVGEDVSEKVENERMYTNALVGAGHDEGGTSFAMLLVDLSEDIVESAVRSVFSQTGKVYTEGFAGLCSSIYLPSQRKQVEEQMSVDAIVKAFQNGQNIISLEYQRTMPEDILPRWVRTTVKTFREPASGGCVKKIV